jgi:hypothetical protein
MLPQYLLTIESWTPYISSNHLFYINCFTRPLVTQLGSVIPQLQTYSFSLIQRLGILSDLFVHVALAIYTLELNLCLELLIRIGQIEESRKAISTVLFVALLALKRA